MDFHQFQAKCQKLLHFDSYSKEENKTAHM